MARTTLVSPWQKAACHASARGSTPHQRSAGAKKLFTLLLWHFVDSHVPAWWRAYEIRPLRSFLSAVTCLVDVTRGPLSNSAPMPTHMGFAQFPHALTLDPSYRVPLDMDSTRAELLSAIRFLILISCRDAVGTSVIKR
jgi:hypothetical protein